MKRNFKLLYVIPFVILLMASCSKWNDVELKDIDHIGGHNTAGESATYYKNLRAWKKSAENYGRPVSFGWFSNWAPVGVVRKGYLESIPDSMDMVSIWGEPFNLTDAKRRDKEIVQRKKGTKVFLCYILHNIGKGITPAYIAEDIKAENPDLSESEINAKIKKAEEVYWGFTSGVQGSEDHTAAIKKYANVLCDSIIKYDYDGLDIDWEPNGAGDGYGNLKGAQGKYLHILIEELGKYLGPKATIDSGKRRYLLVDGELWNVASESGAYVDYFVSQAYGNGASSLDWRENRVRNNFGENYHTMKHIYTENFESYSHNGGYLWSQATYNSEYGPKGGVGAFRFDNDYDNVPDYKYMRGAIQIMLKSYETYLEEHPEQDVNGQNK